MNAWRRRAVLLAILIPGACGAPPAPAPTPTQPPAEPAPAAEAAPQSDAIARADALLEDLKRREAAQAKYDRENPPPAAIPMPMPFAPARPAPAVSEPWPITPATSEAPAETANTAAVRDETWWKQQMQWLQLLLDEALAKLAEAEKLNFANGYADAQAEYKKRATAVADARLAIERLHDEARRAGVPPGWLRVP